MIVIIGGLPLPGSAPVASAADNASEGAGVVRIEVLSNRADVISGDDALVEIVLPKGATPGDLEVTVGGRNVTDAFAPRPKLDNRLVGLLRELEVGRNPVTARLRDGRGAHITITNHPIGGPVFAGPQTQPWAISLHGRADGGGRCGRRGR